MTLPLQIWEDYVEGQEASNGSVVEGKHKEVIKVDDIVL